jgi:hypothetical protein
VCALEKEPDKRYQSARDLQLDLEVRPERAAAGVIGGAGQWMEAFGPKRGCGRAGADRAASGAREPTAPTSLVGRPDVRVR